jgi:hypothetical protein
MVTDISEEHIASIVRTEEYSTLIMDAVDFVLELPSIFRLQDVVLN